MSAILTKQPCESLKEEIARVQSAVDVYNRIRIESPENWHDIYLEEKQHLDTLEEKYEKECILHRLKGGAKHIFRNRT